MWRNDLIYFMSTSSGCVRCRESSKVESKDQSSYCIVFTIIMLHLEEPKRPALGGDSTADDVGQRWEQRFRAQRGRKQAPKLSSY